MVAAKIGRVVLEALAVGSELRLGVLTSLGRRGRDQDLLPVVGLGGLGLDLAVVSGLVAWKEFVGGGREGDRGIFRLTFL